YDVDVMLHPADQTISAHAKVEFLADAPARTLLVELHQDLKVISVVGANGKPLEFDRDRNNPLDLRVNLPEALVAGKTATVTFEYAGPLSLEDDSPTKGIRLGSVDKESAYLLLPARWFPLTNYPSNRYTSNFKITVPDTFAVIGTGKSEMQSGSGGQTTYVFNSERPSPGGTFVAGALQLTPVKVEGNQVLVYTPPSQTGTASNYGAALSHAVTYFSDLFGGLPDRNVVIAQLPDGSLPFYSAPGLVLISARQWTEKPNQRIVAEAAAGQWWNDSVLPATPSDAWLSDGLSRYSGALFAEEIDGESGLRKALEDFAIGTLMYEDAAPISQAQRLQPFSDSYRSVVQDKGALVFHMLHSELGDAPFRALLHNFYTAHAGKNVDLAEFEKLAAAKYAAAPPPANQPKLNLVA
ncbi:MAG TPA: M1 family aminopeptidase, partial [Candidatus Acidoferrales bacterium]|nr:M1 family aminopeptidase [Candidatus Acidoferrales bacterium]